MPTASARTLTLSLDDHTVELAAEALRGEADRRRRTGIKLSGELAAARRDDGADIRTGALQVVNVLADADALGEAAEQIAAAWDAGKPPAKAKRRRPSTSDATPPAPPAVDDDDENEEEDLDLGSGEVIVGDAEIAAAREALGLAPADETPGLAGAAVGDGTVPVLPT